MNWLMVSVFRSLVLGLKSDRFDTIPPALKSLVMAQRPPGPNVRNDRGHAQLGVVGEPDNFKFAAGGP